MRQFMMTIMALTAFGALMATAQADDVHGGPMRNATASGTLAATKSHSVGLSRDAYMSYNRDADQPGGSAACSKAHLTAGSLSPSGAPDLAK
jgi:hypothetical protein